MRLLLLRTILLSVTALLLTALPVAAQWQRLPYNSSVGYTSSSFFNEVFFIDNNNGWITGFGGTVLHTTDGGASWSSGTLPNSSGSANRDFCMISTSVGFVSGEDGIWKTTNGGANWTNITPNSTSPNRSASCWFIDGNVGVYGYGSCGDSTVTFWKTTDAGANWASVSYTMSTTDAAVGGMTYYNGTFYASGGSGKFWYSTDNGANWTSAPTNSGGWQEDLISFGSLFLIASADGTSCGSTGSGKVLRSTNSGSSWSTTSFSGVVMWGVTMYSSSNGWACGDGGHAYRTTDGGANWTEYSCGLDPVQVDDIYFTDATHGWAVGVGIFKYVGDTFSHRPDSIDFGDILVGKTSADSTAWVKALGLGGSITTRAIVGPNMNDFGATGGLPGNISLNSCQESGTPLHFNPASVGLKRAYLEITLSGISKKDTVVLKGNGVKPVLNASSTLQFDTLLCAKEGLDTLTIINVGNYLLQIDSVRIQGSSGGTFEIVTVSGSLPPNYSGGVVVRVKPTGTGPVTGTMAVYSNDPDAGKSPYIVQLRAYRRSVVVGLDKDTLLTLPSVPINTQTSGCISYQNKGDGIQTLQHVLPLVGGDPGINLATPVSNAQVAAAALQQFCFTGTAADTGWHVRRFQIRTSQPCTLDTVITVRFYATNPIIASTPKKIFAAAACEADLLDTLIIANTGNEKLIIPAKPTFGGADAADFSILSPTTWPDTIPVGGTRSLVISFAPDQNLRTRTATITFTNNDRYPQKNPWVIQLQGVRESGKLDYSTRRLDLGSFCLDAAPKRGAVAISNIGNGTSRIVSVSPLDPSAPVSIISNPAGRNLSSTAKDSVVFLAQPLVAGPFTARFLVTYDPCTVTDTLVVTGTANAVRLTATPAQFDFGSQPIGIPVTRTVQLSNNGNVPARITSLQLNPIVAGVTITGPSTPFIIQPGGSQQVTVSLTATSENQISTSVIAIAETDCRDTLEAKVEGAGVSAALFATRSSIDFGSIIDCGKLPVRDTLSVWNLGTAPLTVTSIVPSSGSTARYVIQPSSGGILQPSDKLDITVDVITGTTGDLPDSLVITSDDPKRPEIRIPLRSKIFTADLNYTLPSGNLGDTLTFATLYDCSNTDEQAVVLSNTGMTPDTVELILAQPEFTVIAPGSLQFILAPGADTTIQIRALLPNPGRITGELQVRSLPCSITRSVPLVAEHIKVEASLTDVIFTPVFIDQQPTQDASLNNTGDADQTIERVELVDPAGTFTLSGSYTGTTLQAGADLPLPVKFSPKGPGTATATLRVIISKPCRDTLVATITASATDDRYVVRAYAPAARGRWGTHIEVPVKFENRRSARFDTLQLSITASSRLLDPTGVIHSRPGISARIVKYDPSTGKLELELAGDVQTNSFLSTDTLVSVEYDVLRGNEITSPIRLEFPALPNNVEGETTAGDFALEDYCDAHGRLLEVNGIIELKQNVPNPFNPTTVIEFETAFTDHVVLTLHNDVGQEVGRLVDDILPAGRRQITVDADNLPSGVYTYRLRTGLQVLSRQMIVTK